MENGFYRSIPVHCNAVSSVTAVHFHFCLPPDAYGWSPFNYVSSVPVDAPWGLWGRGEASQEMESTVPSLPLGLLLYIFAAHPVKP